MGMFGDHWWSEEGVGISAFQYGWLVEACGLERWMVECLYLSDLNGEALRLRMVELCRARPQLGAFLFPFVSILLERDEWMDETTFAKFHGELLHLMLTHVGGVKTVWVERSLKSIVEHLLTDLKLDGEDRASPFTTACLSAIPALLQKCDQPLTEMSQCVLQSINNLQSPEATDAPKSVREGIEHISNLLKQRHPSAANLASEMSSCVRLGWLDYETEADDFIEKMWLKCLDENEDVLQSMPGAVPVDLWQMAHACFGWALSQVAPLFSKFNYPIEDSVLATVAHLLLRMLSTKAPTNTCLFYTTIAVLHSVLSQLKSNEARMSLLQSLEVSSFYASAAAVEEIRNTEALMACASRRVIRVMNRLMACGPVHESTISDKLHEEEHLSAWIQHILPSLVLFPDITLRHIVLNAVLYDAPQRLLIQALKLFAPAGSKRQIKLLHLLSQTVSEMDCLSAENLCSFVHSLFNEDDVIGMGIFLDSICAEQIMKWASPSSTAEGLLRGAVGIVETRKCRALIPSCSILLHSLTPLLTFSSVPGNASSPAFASTAFHAERLFDLCMGCFIEMKDVISHDQFRQILEHCQSLPWHLRIRYAPLFSSTVTQDDIRTLFVPESLSSCTRAQEAHAWFRLLSEMLWFGSISDVHAGSLCEALQEQPSLDNDLCQHLAVAFVHEVLLMPAELRSWALTTALAEVASASTATCLERILTTLLPCFLPQYDIMTENNQEDRHFASCALIVEVLCRTLYVMGAQSEIPETEKSNILRQSQIQLSQFCLDTVKKFSVQLQELFILRVFLEVSTLMTSMKEAPFDCADLHLLLSECLRVLIGMAINAQEGMVLPSGASLHLVMEWIMAFLEQTPPGSRNHITLAMNALIKNRLSQL